MEGAQMLENMKILVTGGTGYLGEAICRACVGYGARVFFTWHANEEKATLLEKELSGSRAIRLDIRDRAEVNETLSALHREIEAFDVLINNAAVSQIMPFSMLEPEDLDLLLDVNVKGTVFLTKAAIRPMIRRKKGVVVNIGSLAGHRMMDVPVHYALSKAAMAGFGTALAMELKRYNIRVNTVSPGLLEDGVARGVPELLVKDYLGHCAAGRAGRSDEVAEMVCFLASDRCCYINGQNIFVDGGI
jgi:NAD(P)-dependent dehydrogenase (short-subunit alcohol dehydrogenase family)